MLDAQQVVTKIAGNNAYVYLPKDYSVARRWPLLICTAGNGEVGTDITKLNVYLPCSFITAGTLAPEMIIVCVQPPAIWPALPFLKQVYDSLPLRWSIDLSRVYLSGYSSGGRVADMFATTYPNLVAAVFAMSAPTPNDPVTDAPGYVSFAQAGGHLWALTGSLDNGYGGSLFVSTMNQAVPGSAIYTEIPGMNHCCWATYYNPSYTLNGYNVYNWLLQWSQPRAIALPPLGNKRILLQTPDPRYRQVYYPNVTTSVNPQPGDTLVIPTGIHSFYLQNFAGTPAKPIVIVAQDSGLIGGYGPYAGNIQNAQYFKVMGMHIHGKDSSTFGLLVGAQTSDYEISNSEIQHTAGQGLVLKQDPDSTVPLSYYPNWIIKNISTHDLNIHNCGAEGGYFGYTFDKTKPLASPLVNVQAYNIRIDSTKWDGLQFSGCQNVSVHDCQITNAGMAAVAGQQNGIIIGGETTLKDSAYNLTVTNCSGAGLIIFGRGMMKIRNVTLTNTGYTPGQSALYVADLADLEYNLPPLQLDLKNIAVSKASSYALNVTNMNGTMLAGVISNFTYAGTGQGLFDNTDKIILPLPVSKAIAFVLMLIDGKKLTVYVDWSYTLQ